ncbi:hypothetical protein V2J09_011215 [Rumex salicifolius]
MYRDILNSLFPMKNISMVFWNTRGVGNAIFLSSINELIRLHDISIIVLVETRVSRLRADRICGQIGFNGALHVDVQGFVGGIWLLWHTSNIGHITVEIYRCGEEPWLLSTIYAAPQANKRLHLWQELSDFARINNRPSLLAGDFNSTLDEFERTYNSKSTNATSLIFSEWVDDLHLIDLGYFGPKYTWQQGVSLNTYKASRLDRGLCTDSWRLRFLKVVVHHISGSHSDHLPLLLYLNNAPSHSTANRPFRFQVAWLFHDSFKTNLESTIPITESLNYLATNLKDWNQKIFENIFQRKRKLWVHLEGARRKQAIQPLRNLLHLEGSLCKELEDTLQQEHALWLQKSGTNFLLDGDRNTRYYHLSSMVRRRYNKILTLKSEDGEWITDHESLRQLVLRADTRLNISGALAIPIESIFDTYLGVPMACGKMTKVRNNFLFEKVSKRLRGWQEKVLSMPGRICGFIWGSTSNQKKVHLLAWDKIARPRSLGGLGIRSMRQSNAATLAKLSLKTIQEPSSLWSRVLRRKYCNSRLDVDMFQPCSKSSHMWKGVVHGASYLSKGLKSSVGNGQATLFWDHIWLLDTPLFVVATSPIPNDLIGATVAELWLGFCWKWHLLDTLLPADVKNRLSSVSLVCRDDADDRLFWRHSPSRNFTSKSIKSLFDEDLNTARDARWNKIVIINVI